MSLGRLLVRLCMYALVENTQASGEKCETVKVTKIANSNDYILPLYAFRLPNAPPLSHPHPHVPQARIGF